MKSIAPAVEDPLADVRNVSSNFVYISPMLATEWLKFNKNNRTLNLDRIKLYARLMRDDLWEVNNQGIGFDEHGNLADGQHRLKAIIASGKTIPMLVVHGISTDATMTIDQNMGRTTAEILRRRGGIPQPRIIASWANTVTLLTDPSKGRMSFTDAVEFFEANKTACKWALTVNPSKGPFRISGLWSAIIIAHRAEPKNTRAFAQKIVDGDSLPKKSPEYLLREFIIGHPQSNSKTSISLAHKTFNAIYSSIGGREMTLLRENKGSSEYFIGAYREKL